MTNDERMESILSECKVDYISYDNLHDDNEHGIRLIENAIAKMLRRKPVKEDDGLHCPSCGFKVDRSYCGTCGQRIDYRS